MRFRLSVIALDVSSEVPMAADDEERVSPRRSLDRVVWNDLGPRLEA